MNYYVIKVGYTIMGHNCATEYTINELWPFCSEKLKISDIDLKDIIESTIFDYCAGFITQDDKTFLEKDGYRVYLSDCAITEVSKAEYQLVYRLNINKEGF